MVKISLIASSVRPELYDDFFGSLEDCSVDYEVVFSGNNGYECEAWMGKRHRYIQTKNIKPAQCYEIARRDATGELICWVADDAEFVGDILGRAYRYWKEQHNRQLILSLQTMESGYAYPGGELVDMNIHRFFGGRSTTPLMAPIGLMSREYLEDLRGFDRRYVCGQYENDCVMNAYANFGTVEVFGDEKSYVDIDHLGKSIRIGESTDRNSFQQRPFASGYPVDRKVLETSWVPLDGNRHDGFEPYEDADILTKSQSNKGKWE